MKRAPHIEMTEREFLRLKRHQMKWARYWLGLLEQDTECLPNLQGQTQILEAAIALDDAHRFLKASWRKA